MTDINCSECGEPVESEEYINPETGEPYLEFDKTPAGESLCPDCLERLAPLCPVCEDEHMWDREEIGKFFIVTPNADLSIQEGVYKILSHPYYWTTYLDVDVYADAVEKVELVPPLMDGSGLYFICDDCAAKLGEPLRDVCAA